VRGELDDLKKRGLAQRYKETPAVYGESAGTSATFIKEREEMGTLGAINRLAARSGIFAETGDDSIISGELPDKVSLKTRVRGAIVVGLSAPQMVVQATGVNPENPIVKRAIRITNPWTKRWLITKKARENYQAPVEWQSGWFSKNAEGNLTRVEE